MRLNPDQIYHVYNRGNNRQLIFLEKDNYDYFLRKINHFIVPYCELLAFVFMPNHFHLLITPNERSNIPFRTSNQKDKSLSKSPVKMTMFSRGLQQTLSTYARGINKRYDRSGSLFQQNTHVKLTSSDSHLHDYSLCCFNYIHNNPVLVGLVKSPEQYLYSSYRDYFTNNPDSICNLDLARNMLSLDTNDLFDYMPAEVPAEIMKSYFESPSL